MNEYSYANRNKSAKNGAQSQPISMPIICLNIEEPNLTKMLSSKNVNISTNSSFAKAQCPAPLLDHDDVNALLTLMYLLALYA